MEPLSKRLELLDALDAILLDILVKKRLAAYSLLDDILREVCTLLIIKVTIIVYDCDLTQVKRRLFVIFIHRRIILLTLTLLVCLSFAEKVQIIVSPPNHKTV